MRRWIRGETWQFVKASIRYGDASETCGHHGTAPNLFYYWKDEAEQGSKAEDQMVQ